jgi:hypothetical protein
MCDSGEMNTKLLYVRALTDAERRALEAALRSPDAFVLRRAQILLASARGEGVGSIAPLVGFTRQAVRQIIHRFHAEGVGVLERRSSRNHTLYYCFDTSAATALRDLLHHSPRLYGKETSVWTLELAAEVAFERGLTAWRVSGETIRATLSRMGMRWKRAKHWITSPDPEYARKKAARDRLIRLAEQHEDWLLGFEDEVWWSRLAQPRCTSGRTTTSPSGWSSRRSRTMTLTPRHWPVMGCWPATRTSVVAGRKPCGCVLWMGVRSVQ